MKEKLRRSTEGVAARAFGFGDHKGGVVDSTASAFGKTLANIFLVASGALAGVLGLYFWRFHGPLSAEHVRWNEFGGFLGGTVGPLFAFLSLIVLLRSLHVQWTTLAETKRQGVLQELQRLASSTAYDIDAALRLTVREDGNIARALAAMGGDDLTSRYGRPLTIGEAIRFAWLRGLPDARASIESISLIAKSTEASEVFRGLIRLDACLLEFLNQGGDPVVGKLYGSRYIESALLLSFLISLNLHMDTTIECDFDELAALSRLGIPADRTSLHVFAVEYRDKLAARRAATPA